MRKRHRKDEEAEINLTPMLDVTFIMLIFFIVTTSFVKEIGMDVSRPQKSQEAKPDPTIKNILIAITQANQIYMDKREIDLRVPRDIGGHRPSRRYQRRDVQVLHRHPTGHALLRAVGVHGQMAGYGAEIRLARVEIHRQPIERTAGGDLELRLQAVATQRREQPRYLVDVELVR